MKHFLRNQLDAYDAISVKWIDHHDPVAVFFDERGKAIREEHLPDEGAEGLVTWFESQGFTLQIKRTKYGNPSQKLTFKGHRYEVYHQSNVYEAAAEFAAKKGGHVLTIEEDEEAEFLRSKISRSTWLAASDKETEGTWIWTAGEMKGEQFWMGKWLNDDDEWNSGFAVDGLYSAWGEGEPNDHEDEDCVVMSTLDGEPMWMDTGCTSKYPVVIEYEPDDHEHSEL